MYWEIGAKRKKQIAQITSYIDMYIKMSYEFCSVTY